MLGSNGEKSGFFSMISEDCTLFPNGVDTSPSFVYEKTKLYINHSVLLNSNKKLRTEGLSNVNSYKSNI